MPFTSFKHALMCGAFVFSFSSTLRAMPQIENAVSFYRDKDSLFESGQINSLILEKKQTHTLNEYFYETQWMGRKIKVKPNEFINHQVVNVTGKAYDIGAWYTVEDAYLRNEPKINSSIITTIPKNQKIKSKVIVGEWIKINYRTYSGYVNINQLVGRADFAIWAHHPRKKWFLIKNRVGAFVYSKKNEKILLNEIDGYITHPQKVVITNPNSHHFPLKTTLYISQLRQQKWAISKVPGHGTVWWKNTTTTNKFSSLSVNKLSIEELLKKDIFSCDFSSRGKIKGIVSSNGIYITRDGIHWTELSQFKNENMIVSLSKQASPQSLFVGPYVSYDQGLSFSPYIRWDQITKTIQSHTQSPTRWMKLHKIEPLPHQKIKITVDTGHQKLRLQSLLHFNNWKIVN